MNKNIISHSYLIENYHLDKSTGIFTHRTEKMSFNGKRVANKKGSILKYHTSTHGYKTGLISRKLYRLHILVVYYVTGAYPVYKIKFKDNNKLNIEFDNLIEQKPLHIMDKDTGIMMKICITCGIPKYNNKLNFKQKWETIDTLINTCRDCESKIPRERTKRKSGKPLIFNDELNEWVYKNQPPIIKKKIKKKKVIKKILIPLTKDEKIFQKEVLRDIKQFNNSTSEQRIEKEKHDLVVYFATKRFYFDRKFHIFNI